MQRSQERKLSHQVVLIGLDGATFDLIEPWIESGELPHLKALMEKGTWGELTSTIPPVSAPALVSLMTGKNPGKHGIFDFTQTEWTTYSGWTFSKPSGRLASSSSIRDRSFWEILGENGNRVGVMNLPLTYPPKKVNGFLISGFMTPPDSNRFTYPKELGEEIEGYKIDVDSLRNWLFTSKNVAQRVNKEKLLQEQYEVTRKRADVLLQLLRREETDFVLCFFKGTDNLMHYFWNNKNALLDYYKLLDSIIGEIKNTCGSNNDFLIFSDHGFGPEATKFFFVNAWLRKRGYLKFSGRTKSELFGRAFNIAVGVLGRLNLLKRLPKRVKDKGKNSQLSTIDFNKTVAIGENIGGLFGIRVNRDSKEKISELKAELQDLEDPDTGSKIIANVYNKEEIYSGKYLDYLPELMLVPDHNYLVRADLFEKGITKAHETIREGNHTNGYLNGILIAEGKNIKNGEKVEGASITDLAPTILHLMGVSVPEDMDGNVLSSIFEEESGPARRSIERYNDTEKERIRRKAKQVSKLR